MKIFKFLLFILTFMCYINMDAQEGTFCGSDAMFPVENVSQFSQTMNYNTYCFKTYIHVIRDKDGNGGVTEEQVNIMFSKLRQSYSEIGIAFSWDSEINYVDSDDIYNNSIPIGLFLIGINNVDGIDIALFPEDYALDGGIASGVDGITSMALFGRYIYGNNEPILETKVSVHEMGHVFGLNHTHGSEGSEPELVDGTNCLVAGDGLCGTPADPNMEYNVGKDCHFDSSEILDANDEMYDPDESNYMSYSNPECYSSFSDDQINFMKNYIDSTNKFQETLGSFSSDPNEIPFTQGLEVNVSATKNTDEAFNGDIVINADLTIENCTIELTEGHKIIVNPGASLTVRNSRIRTYTGGVCYFPMEAKTKWEGIEVVPGIGNFTNISVNTNSIIEPSENGIYNPDGTSGFLNLAFNNSILNGPAIDLSNTFGLARLLKSNFDHPVNVTDNFYLKVEGCSFDFPLGNSDSGIRALNTHLHIAKATDGLNTSFTNCGRGVEFISTSAHSLKVSNTDFDKVLTGVDAKSVAGFATIHDCIIGLRDPVGFQNLGDGIILRNFMDFEIYMNEITGVGSTIQDGIEIRQTGTNDNPNLLINNAISNCNVGIRTNNADLGSNMSGVEFECNTMASINSDNFITTLIGPHQGRGGVDFPSEEWRPAGNEFDGSTTGFEDFNYTGGVLTQQKKYHFRDLGLENIEDFNTGNSIPNAPDQFVVNKLTGGEQPQCTYPVTNNDPNPMPQANIIRTNALDGGNTEGSVNLVNNNSSSDPSGVLATILGSSPWVSIAVVQALFANSQYYTESQIAQVIIQNPGVLVDGYISEVIFETNSFTPSNQQLMLQAYQSGDSRITHEQGLLDIIYVGTLHIKETMNAQIESGNFDEVAIRSQLGSKISSTKLYQTIESYVNDGDYTNAISTLNSRLGDFTFDPILLDEASKYAEILVFGAYLQSNGESWTKISTTDKQRLVSIANNYHGLATVKARNILRIYHAMTFGAMPSKHAYSPISFTASSPRSRQKNGFVKVYPNPSSDILNIDVNNDQYRYTINLVSLYGVLVKSISTEGSTRIDVSDLTNGVYYYTISYKNEVILTEKLIIID